MPSQYKSFEQNKEIDFQSRSRNFHPGHSQTVMAPNFYRPQSRQIHNPKIMFSTQLRHNLSTGNTFLKKHHNPYESVPITTLVKPSMTSESNDDTIVTHQVIKDESDQENNNFTNLTQPNLHHIAGKPKFPPQRSYKYLQPVEISKLIQSQK